MTFIPRLPEERPEQPASGQGAGCELCGREKPLTFHHLIPRKCHRKKWFLRHFDKVEMKTRGLDLCRDCHRHLHRSFDEQTLGRHYNTREALMAQEEISKFVAWVKKKG
jgi:hypothetical protein